jgi:alanine racemase
MASQKTAQKRTVILSDFVETGKTDQELYRLVGEQLMKHKVTKIIAIGEKIRSFLPSSMSTETELFTFPTVESFTEQFKLSGFHNETILIKGARRYRFERIVQLLQTRVHLTHLEIDLNALAHNLKQYQKLLKKGTKVMAMVKAFSYGSGGAEVASVLQYNNAHYLGVAYADEGAELRRAGIDLPIMVMNADASSFTALAEYNLQPVLYSFSVLQAFENFVKDQGIRSYPVHIELETGMNRLGFLKSEVDALADHLQKSGFYKVESVFSHLAASEDPEQDGFTMQQAADFTEMVIKLQKALPYTFLKHISNSAAIIRHPNLQWDMVRLGIGLYGVEINTNQLSLEPVATMKTTIAQIRNLKAGDTVSYNRKGVIREDARIATVRIGYADGYSRHLGNGVGKMWVQGKAVPTVGVVCMDMTMIDVTGIGGVKEGDEVIVFGKQLPVQQLAQWAGTIPYEIMTSVSARVKRVYFQQ